jgi:catechol-2,3-dioxygenase
MTTQETAPGAGVRELGHLVLYVADIGTSAAFYEDALGWRRLTSPPELGTLPIALFSSGRTHHELLLIEVGRSAAPVPQGRHLGLYHFGLRIGDTDDDLRQIRDRLNALGVPIVGVSDHGVTHSLYVLDPDGNEVELYVDVADVDWGDFAAIAGPPRPLTL